MKSISSAYPPDCCEKGPSPSCKWKEFCKENGTNTKEHWEEQKAKKQ